MIKKSYVVILLFLSAFLFGMAFYAKYVKVYMQEVEKKEMSKESNIQFNQLKLNDNIALLENLEESLISAGGKLPKENRNKEALKKLKIINAISITAMIISIFLFLWLLRKLMIQNKYKKLTT